MKYILVLTLLVLSSCTAKDPNIPEAKEVVYIPGYSTIYEFTYQGHDYLYDFHTGMIHSESCESSEHYDSYKH